MAHPDNANLTRAHKSIGYKEMNKFFFDQDGLPGIRTGTDLINTVTERVLDAQGRMSTLKMYSAPVILGAKATLLTFSYANPTYPEKWTKIETTLVDV